jgi:hypothetical protein
MTPLADSKRDALSPSSAAFSPHPGKSARFLQEPSRIAGHYRWQPQDWKDQPICRIPGFRSGSSEVELHHDFAS